MNDKEMLAFWKANEKPFGMATCEQRNWLLNFKGPVESYGTYEYQEWGRDKDDHIRLLGRTYRIPADYQPAPKGRWVECELFDDESVYSFRHPKTPGVRTYLSGAPGMVGFGGVRYEGRDQWARTPRWEGEGFDRPPLKPAAVRFWVEE